MRCNESCIITLIPNDTPVLDKEIILQYSDVFKNDAKEVISEVEEYGSGAEYEIEIYLVYRKKEVK